MLFSFCTLRWLPGLRYWPRPLLLCLLLNLGLATASAAAPGPDAQGPLQPPKSPVLPPEQRLDSAATAQASQVISLPASRQTAAPMRRPDAARLQEMRSQKEFQYVKPEEKPEQQSVWSLFWWRLMQWLSKLLSGPGYENRGRYVVYALFGAAFLYALARVLQLDITGLYGRRNRAVPLPYETAMEDIHAVDFGPALADAEATGNFRLAVRLGYLQVLRHLSERHLIAWQPEKTNHDYLRELSETRWAPDFATLTRQFEYVWYGELPLTPEAYPALRESRQAFLHQLTRVAA